MARRAGRSKADLIREVLGRHITQTKDSSFDVPDWVGMGHSEKPYSFEEDEALLGRHIEEDHKRVVTGRETRREGDGSS